MFQLSPEGEEERDTCRPLTVGTSQVTRQAETEADTGVTHLHSILLQRQGKQLRGGGDVGGGHRHEAAHSRDVYTLLGGRRVGSLGMQRGTAVRVGSGQAMPL